MTFIIAEAGSNHNGKFDMALDLIKYAQVAGADAIKFQVFSSETLFSKFASSFANYGDIRQIIKDNEIPRHWLKDLKMASDDAGIEFMATPFDEKAVDQLMEIGVKRMKIAGFEATDPRFVSLVASTRLPLIISIGIGANADNVATTINIASSYSNDVTLLHCNNAYPTPYADIDLHGMVGLARYGYKVGLSDHTPGILIPPVAVGMGATCIEKHFTSSTDLPGPDHHFAIDPIELTLMVRNIRIVESAMDSKKDGYGYTASEKQFDAGTRSVVALTELNPDDVITLDNVTTKRHYFDGAIRADQYFKIIGKKVKTYTEKDEVLSWDKIKN